ncbi:MAG TPA: hypothetical protein ENG34_00410 [Candidatus Aenigmarchaeota archaeon]|nr:hypothetical protein [Candidatus Aenigmarchaeota archaeon]
MVFEKEKEAFDIRTFTTEILNRVDSNTRRIRSIEQRLNLLESRISSLEEKLIDEIDKLGRGFEQLQLDVKAVSESLKVLRAEMLKMNKNMEKTALKAEVKELATLLDLYNPIKSSFVTKEEVRRMLEELEKKITQR